MFRSRSAKGKAFSHRKSISINCPTHARMEKWKLKQWWSLSQETGIIVKVLTTCCAMCNSGFCILSCNHTKVKHCLFYTQYTEVFVQYSTASVYEQFFKHQMFQVMNGILSNKHAGWWQTESIHESVSVALSAHLCSNSLCFPWNFLWGNSLGL